MPQVDLIAESFVAAPPADIAAVLREPVVLAGLWPGLRLRAVEDRGALGMRWSCTGALVGSCEVWLQAYGDGDGDGAIVHCYLRGDPSRRGHPQAPRTVSARRAARERRRRQHQITAVMWALKDRLESRRPLGAGPRV